MSTNIGVLKTAQRLFDEVLSVPEPDESRLALWSTLPKVDLDKDEVTVWEQLERSGLLPHVAPNQVSPVLGEGNFIERRQRVAEFRAIKLFNEGEMRDLVSPDPLVAQTAAQKIATEMFDLRRRAFQTQEFLAWELGARGSVAYTAYDKQLPVHLTGSIPILTAAIGSTKAWDLTAGKTSEANVTPVDDIDTYLREYQVLNGVRPDAIWMTSETFKRLRNSYQVKSRLNNLLRVQNFADAIPSASQLSSAFDWPPIRVYDESFFLQYTLTNSETAGSDVTVELGGDQVVLSAGDEVYIGDGTGEGFTASGSYTERKVVKSATAGTSIVVDLTNNHSAGANLVCRKTYMPDDRILFARNDFGRASIGEAPYGINADGTPMNRRGLTMDAFMVGNEPNLQAARRVWIRDFPLFGRPRELMSVRVRYKSASGVY